MKRLSILLIREMQTKTTMRLSPGQNGLSKRPQITNVGGDMEKREPLNTAGGNVNWCSHSEIYLVWWFLKNEATI